jgi:anthranilate synthase component 2
MSKILLIDNYDSFTYNIYHYLEELWEEGVEVIRNDELTLEKAQQYDRIVISPGPNLPEAAGNLLTVLKSIAAEKKILGICLGLQAIAEVFDLKLKNLKEVIHGQSTPIKVTDSTSLLFKGLPQQFKVGRYHSWVIDEKSNFDNKLIVTAVDEFGNIMAVDHPTLPIHAVQFHPESVLCEHGKEMLANWLNGN